jgi:hypothetical protein
MTSSNDGMAQQAGDSATLEAFARVGLIAYGVIHILISWLAMQLAWGASSSKSADPSGALRTLADQPMGSILLWLVAVGLVALALWQGSEAIWGYRNWEGAKRVRMRTTSWARAIIYAALSVGAASVALGSGSSSSQSQERATSGVLAWPAGQVIVVVVGLVIVGVGVAGVVKGVRSSFSEEIDTSSMSPVVRQAVARLGQVGYIAKGVALGLVGGLLGYAAVTFDQQEARGWTARCRRSWHSRSGGFCSRSWRLDSSPSACSRCSSRDTGGCSHDSPPSSRPWHDHERADRFWNDVGSMAAPPGSSP